MRMTAGWWQIRTRIRLGMAGITDFTFIRDKRIKKEIKDYVWSHFRYQKKTLTTLRQELSWMHYYEQWLYERGVHSLAQITGADAEGFLSYLHVCISKKTSRPLCMVTQKHIYQTVRGVYLWHASGGTDKNKDCYLRALLYFPMDAYPRTGAVHRTLPAEEEQIRQLLGALRQQKNDRVGLGSELLLMTGLTPADLVTLEIDSLQMDTAGLTLRYYHHRTKQYRSFPLSRRGASIIRKLYEQTQALRAEAPEAYRTRLFLYRNRENRVRPYDPDLFRYQLRKSQADAALRSGKVAGEPVTCSMLRAFLQRDLSEQQVPAAVIRELTGCALFAGRSVQDEP